MGEIYRDDTIVITQNAEGYYIQSFKAGQSPDHFNDLLMQFPNIKITNFMTVRKALADAPYGPELFAVAKQRITVDISYDSLEAYITLCLMPEELNRGNRKDLIMEIMDTLRKENINYGIMLDALRGELAINTPILIARGVAPVNGKDAIVKKYMIEELKPKVIENGNVDFYDLNLIYRVNTGDWLGERTDPIPGIPGKNVYGTEIKPVEGAILPLIYDRQSVELVRDNGKDILYSLKTGAVHYVGDSVSVYDVLEIRGNIDFNTGNLDFNGYVTVKGSVEENFSVRAKKDIEINGEYGIGGVDTIESQEGNIYIRGGVAGKNKAKIICKKNLYAKYLSDVDVVCEGSVYVGFYIRNTTIRAKQVIVDSPRGQIAGGFIDADIRVECAEIGNWMESKTRITIRGFNRNGMQSRIDEILAQILQAKEQLVKLKQAIKKPEDGSRSSFDSSMLQKNHKLLRQVQDEIKELEAERLSIMNFMKTPGGGAVIVKKRIFPKVKLTLQGETLDVMEEAMMTTFVVKDGIVQSL